MNDDDVIFEEDGLEEKGGSEEELEAMESRADGKVQKLKKELEEAKKDRQEYLDGWQRAKADYVNAAKRFEEDRFNSLTLGKVAALRSFIVPMDSLERAKALGELPEAFQAIAKQLEDAAKTQGLEQFGAVGEKFDPVLHEALGQEPTEIKEEDDTVIQVLERGWKMGDSVVRPAKVRVASFEG